MEILFYTSITILVLSIIFMVIRRPTHRRDWAPEHANLPTATIEGETIAIKNIVSAQYSSKYKCEVKYHSKIFNINDIKSLWLLIEYFPMFIGPIEFRLAHSFLTFALKDGSFISISVAGRRKEAEKVTFARILPHRNEIIYKIIDESDTVLLRSFFCKNELRLYKLNASPKIMRGILLSILKDVNKLSKKPYWFDTFTRNCTTEMVKHLRSGGIKIPKWHPSYIFTTSMDKLLHRLNIIDSDLSFNLSRKRHNITPKVIEISASPNLSQKIREYIGK